jgi:excisionase family DNA binding protein
VWFGEEVTTPPGSPPPLRDIAEAAAWLSVSPSWLQKRVSARLVPHTRIGKHVRFTQDHLDQIVAEGETPVIEPPSYLSLRIPSRGRRRGTHP